MGFVEKISVVNMSLKYCFMVERSALMATFALEYKRKIAKNSLKWGEISKNITGLIKSTFILWQKLEDIFVLWSGKLCPDLIQFHI